MLDIFDSFVGAGARAFFSELRQALADARLLLELLLLLHLVRSDVKGEAALELGTAPTALGRAARQIADIFVAPAARRSDDSRRFSCNVLLVAP